MKNIGIFCDGTWQHIDQKNPTNVALLAQAVMSRVGVEGQDVGQFVYYDDGVGVSEGVLGAGTQLLGGALGKGLDHKITRAYEILSLNYDPGDRVFIFGFSRGAYTARSLAGLIRWLGILRRQHVGFSEQAMSIYRDRPPKAKDPTQQQKDLDVFTAKTQAFRAVHSHAAAPFTGAHGYVDGKASSLTPASDCTWIQYVGVFDTVGSLGVPSNIPFAAEVNQQYRFYDTSLSAMVRSARHAVSIDERRNTFQPALWDNIAALNTNAGADAMSYERRPYQQVWFPGGHGSVGGGSDDGGISLPALLWIAEGAARAGFGFEPAVLNALAAKANPLAAFQPAGFSLGALVIGLDGASDRPGPDHFDEVSLSACLRAKGMAYAPPPLKRAAAVQAALATFEKAPDPQTFYAP